MVAFYKDGARYTLDTGRTTIRLELHNLGVPTVRGTVRATVGELIVDADGVVRSADLQLDPGSLAIHGPFNHGNPIRSLFGRDEKPTFDFRTTWARPIGHGAVELEGLLTMRGQEHLFSLRSEGGIWEPDPEGAGQHWHRSAAHGVLDRKVWIPHAHLFDEASDLLLGHDVHMIAELYVGPRI
jgi:polyisoprenoid-binding protein YceI